MFSMATHDDSAELKDSYPKFHDLLTNFIKTADELLEDWDNVHGNSEESTIQDGKFGDAYPVCAWEMCDDVFLCWHRDHLAG